MKIVVFFSGSGTNLKSILDHQNQFNYEVCACFTNNPEAKGLIFCKEYGINCKIINHKDFDDREEYDGIVNSFLENLNPDLIVLAGYMRIMSKSLVDNWEGQIVNIHPSLLPKYKGLNTHKRVIENNEKYTGCTIHYVNNFLDSGKIIFQRKVKITKKDDERSIEKKVLKIEHLIYPVIINKVVSSL